MAAMKEKQSVKEMKAQKAWGSARLFKTGLSFKVAPKSLFSELEEFDERHSKRDVAKAEDLLLRTMEAGQANELNMAVEIASRHGVTKETVEGARLMAERLTNQYLGFDGPGAYKNKLAQAEKDDVARQKQRAEHAAAVKKFREREVQCLAREKELADKTALVEGEVLGLKTRLADEILDAVAWKATLRAAFDEECVEQKKEVADAFAGLDDERRRRFEADMRRKDEDAAMVKRLSAALQGKRADGETAFEEPEKELAAAHADALAMAWSRSGPVSSMAMAVKMKADAMNSSRELEEATAKRMAEADPLRETGLGAVVAAAKRVGGTDPQAVAKADAALALEAAIKVRRPEIIGKALDKLKVFGMHESSPFFDASGEIHAQLDVAAKLRSAIISRTPNAEVLERCIAAAQEIEAVARASRGVPVGVVRFDTSLADIPKVLVELCSVGNALAGLLRAETDDDLENVEAAVRAARDHTLKYNAPLRAVLNSAEPRIAGTKSSRELFLKLDDRMRTGDAFVNQGLSAAIAEAERAGGSELYDIEAAKHALKLRMAILAEDSAGIRKAVHGIRVARGNKYDGYKHGLIDAGLAMEARLGAQHEMLIAMNQRHLPRLMAAVTEGANQEKQAGLLPFSEKQVLGSLPGVLKDARAALENMKAGLSPEKLEEAEIAAGELLIAERERKEAIAAAVAAAAAAGEAPPELPPAAVSGVAPPPPKAPPPPIAAEPKNTAEDAEAEAAAAEAAAAAAKAQEEKMAARLAEAAAAAEEAEKEAAAAEAAAATGAAS